MTRSHVRFCFPLLATVMLSLALAIAPWTHAQERLPKLRISNAGFTITALPLLAAKEWNIFSANGLDMEVILMQSALVPAALTQGDIDYQAGVGPASVNATMTGFATRAIWFSSDRISYWLMAKPQFKTLESLRSKKIAITGLGGTVHVALLLALEKLGVPAELRMADGKPFRTDNGNLILDARIGPLTDAAEFCLKAAQGQVPEEEKTAPRASLPSGAEQGRAGVQKQVRKPRQGQGKPQGKGAAPRSHPSSPSASRSPPDR